MNKFTMIFMILLYGILAGVSTAGSLADNGNGTVTDSATLLTWQQGENGISSWNVAITICEDLTLAGSSDWRLPNHKELLTLVDYQKNTPPLINTTFFPNFSNTAIRSSYWSSTTLSNSTSYAFLVEFYNGNSISLAKSNTEQPARCVRGGQ